MINVDRIMRDKMILYIERLQKKILKVYKSNIFNLVDESMCREVDVTVSIVIERAIRDELIEKYTLKEI